MTYPINFDIFRENIKKARIIKEWTADAVSEGAGLKQKKRVSDIELGRGTPSIEEIHSICSFLKQDVSQMLYQESEMVLTFKPKTK